MSANFLQDRFNPFALCQPAVTVAGVHRSQLWCSDTVHFVKRHNCFRGKPTDTTLQTSIFVESTQSLARTIDHFGTADSQRNRSRLFHHESSMTRGDGTVV